MQSENDWRQQVMDIIRARCTHHQDVSLTHTGIVPPDCTWCKQTHKKVLAALDVALDGLKRDLLECISDSTAEELLEDQSSVLDDFKRSVPSEYRL